MCLIVFAHLSHPEYPLIFAGNRDEFRGRPTAPAQPWEEDPSLIAGRDLKAGGTWLGVTRDGRFATVTNFREPGEQRREARSRGELVTGFLLGTSPAAAFTDTLKGRLDEYNGFNLIFGDEGGLFYVSNRGGQSRRLEPGLYGLSNGQLDTPWPKVRRAKMLFRKALSEDEVRIDSLLDVLADKERPTDDDLPQTGLGREWERAVSSIFIAGPEYGTRASTAVTINRRGRVTFVERSFGPDGVLVGTEEYEFEIDA